eukprot:m.73768 g.73768  ORF g.73768 m.73768 type:complete len:108 (+) comp8040_c0_seq3:3902-4225(+)
MRHQGALFFLFCPFVLSLFGQFSLCLEFVLWIFFPSVHQATKPSRHLCPYTTTALCPAPFMASTLHYLSRRALFDAPVMMPHLLFLSPLCLAAPEKSHPQHKCTCRE